MPLALGKARANEAHGQRVAGEYGDAIRVVANQCPQALADFLRGVAVVGQGEDGARVLAAHTHEVGDAMYQHPRFTRAGASENEHIGVVAVVGDDGALAGLGQGFDNVVPGLRCGLSFQLVFPTGQPALAEGIAFEAKVIHGQLQGIGHFVHAALGVLGHDVNLPGQLVVVQFQRLVVALIEFQAPVAFQVQGHGRAENRQAFVQAQYLLLMQPEQGTFDQFAHVRGFNRQQGIAGDAVGELPECAFSQQVDTACPLGQAGQPVFEQVPGGSAAAFGDLFEHAPMAIEFDVHGFRVAGALEIKAAASVGAIAAITRETGNDLAQALRQGLRVALILELLGEQAQVERITLAGHGIGRAFAQAGNDGAFEFAGLFKALFRGLLDTHMDEGGHPRIVAGNAQIVEQVQCLA